MTFEDIQKANESIKTTEIKGKQYAEVNQRIKAFRQLYPEGFIKTEILSLEGGIVTMQAKVGWYFADGSEVILATGTAQEKETTSYINKTSYIENCETSAVGRALGMIALGVDTSIASAEEVENAISGQEQMKQDEIKAQKITALDLKAIKNRYPKKEQQDNILEYFGIQKLEDMTFAQFMELKDKDNKKEKADDKK
ncbi:MAG: hypothetical protein II266_06485 [Clostridia bacterium]|nr:hypothetical protein [Clostridia bacterium]